MASYWKLVLAGVFAIQLCVVGLAWTGEIKGRVFCDVCADGGMGAEDFFLQGAEVAVLCLTESGEVLNYQAFTNSRGIFTVAETMPESNRWDMCLVRPISSLHHSCNVLGEGVTATKFKYSLSSGHFYIAQPIFYQQTKIPLYC